MLQVVLQTYYRKKDVDKIKHRKFEKSYKSIELITTKYRTATWNGPMLYTVCCRFIPPLRSWCWAMVWFTQCEKSSLLSSSFAS